MVLIDVIVHVFRQSSEECKKRFLMEDLADIVACMSVKSDVQPRESRCDDSIGVLLLLRLLSLIGGGQ